MAQDISREIANQYLPDRPATVFLACGDFLLISAPVEKGQLVFTIDFPDMDMPSLKYNANNMEGAAALICSFVQKWLIKKLARFVSVQAFNNDGSIEDIGEWDLREDGTPMMQKVMFMLKSLMVV